MSIGASIECLGCLHAHLVVKTPIFACHRPPLLPVQMSKTYAGGFTSLSQRVDSEQELVTGGIDGVVMFWDCDVADAPVTVRRCAPCANYCGEFVHMLVLKAEPLFCPLLQTIELPGRPRINDVCVSPSGRFLCIVTDDSLLSVYSMEVSWVGAFPALLPLHQMVLLHD